MPRIVRNFWITADVDGRKGAIATGPRGKTGGIYLAIQVRNGGAVQPALTVIGTAEDDGRLTIEVIDTQESPPKVIHTLTTTR